MKAVFAVIFSVFLAACAGLAPVRNVDDALAYAKGQATAAVVGCTDAARHGEIAPDDLRVCVDAAERASKIIDTARLSDDVVEKESALLTGLNVLKIAQDLARK